MRLLTGFALLLILQACKHPLSIIGEGDIVDLNQSGRGCTLEQFLAGDPACLGNEVIAEDYFVNYTAVPRPGWTFLGWIGACGHLSEGLNCRFDAPAIGSIYFDEQGIDTSSFKLTAVFEREDPAPTFTVGGVVLGLTGTLELTNNGGDPLSLSGDGAFTFATALLDSANFDVAVSANPANQTCSIAGGTGAISGADITTVEVTCEAVTVTLTTTISGLADGAVLDVTINGVTTTVGNGSSFRTFTVTNNGEETTASLANIPNGYFCSLEGDTNTPIESDREFIVTCGVIPMYTVGGTVAGLAGELIVQNNGADDLIVDANGSFTFATALFDQTDYTATIVAQPLFQTCNVSDGAGAIAAANVTNIQIDCATLTADLSTTVSGLSGDAQLDVVINGDTFTVGNTTITRSVDLGSSISVTLDNVPAGFDCSVSGDLTGIIEADRDVTVSCIALTYEVTITVEGLQNGDTLSLQVNSSLLSLGASAETVTVTHGAALVVSGTIPNTYSCPGYDDGIDAVTADQDYPINCELVLFDISGQVSGLPAVGNLAVRADNDGTSTDVQTNGAGEFSFAGIAAPGESVTLSLVDTPPAGYECPDSVSVADIDSDRAAQNIVCSEIVAETGSVDVQVDRINAAGELEVTITTDSGFTASVTSAADDFEIPDVPLGEDYTVTLSTPPANPAECTLSSGSGTVGDNNVVDISCRINVDLMGLQTELEDCLYDESAGAEELGPDGDLHLYLDGVESNLDCDNRDINTLQGVGFLAEQVRKIALTNNQLDSDDLPDLHPLDDLRFLALGGNAGISDAGKIAQLKAALPRTAINLSNTNAATVQLLRLVLDTNDIDPAVLGSVRLRTDFWLGDNNNDEDLIAVYDTFTESITTDFITTRYNGDDNNTEDQLSYAIDLAHRKDGVSCASSAERIAEEVETTLGQTQNSYIQTTVTCTESTSLPEMDIMFTGDAPDGGLTVIVFVDNGAMNPVAADDNRHLIVGEWFILPSGTFIFPDHGNRISLVGSGGTANYPIANVPMGDYQVVISEDDPSTSCSVDNATGAIAYSDVDNVLITCTGP